jgi:ribosomal protein L40E
MDTKGCLTAWVVMAVVSVTVIGYCWFMDAPRRDRAAAAGRRSKEIGDVVCTKCGYVGLLNVGKKEALQCHACESKEWRVKKDETPT